MRLLAAKISGYRSFGRTVEVSFQPGMNCVIGPDGCGKTSLIEAILWVFGVTRQGDSPDDLLFHGVGSLQAADEIHVELQFAETPWQNSEMTVSRSLTRESGLSEYRINDVAHEEVFPSAYAEMMEGVHWISDHSSLEELARNPPRGQILFLDELDRDLSPEEFQQHYDAVSKLRDTNQIILITHSKVIAELSEYMIGVVMEEYGISKVIGMTLTPRVSGEVF